MTRTAVGDRRRTGRIAEARKVSAAQVALAWLLRRPAVTSLIIGGRTEAQFRDNLACVNVKLSADERARLDEASLPPLIYPYWHQSGRRRTASGARISRCTRHS